MNHPPGHACDSCIHAADAYVVCSVCDQPARISEWNGDECPFCHQVGHGWVPLSERVAS